MVLGVQYCFYLKARTGVNTFLGFFSSFFHDEADAVDEALGEITKLKMIRPVPVPRWLPI